MALANAKPQPIPIKIVVPLLEYASREEIDDDYMVDMWAALLVSASTSDTISPRFVALLSELNGRQAQLLTHIKGNDRRRGDNNNTDYFSPDFRNFIEQIIGNYIHTHEKRGYPDSFGPTAQALDKYFSNCRDVMLLELRTAKWTSHSERPEYFTVPDFVTPLMRVDVDILGSLGLVEVILDRRELDTNPPETRMPHHFSVLYCGITSLGARLLALTDPKAK